MTYQKTSASGLCMRMRDVGRHPGSWLDCILRPDSRMQVKLVSRITTTSSTGRMGSSLVGVRPGQKGR
jgi:hypothetical protein